MTVESQARRGARSLERRDELTGPRFRSNNGRWTDANPGVDPMKTDGFTLIEMMIVIAIIAIIAAIALPSLLRSRVDTNEAAAIWDLRTVATAQASFNGAKGRYGSFGDLTSTLDGAGTAFLDSTWREGVEKAGYVFAMPVVTDSAYECYADPKVPGTTATRWLRVDSSGLVRWSRTARPTTGDPVIGSS